ncbi:MAG: 4'-phosphopantetheinyl transferase family protein [Parabacteroides sp.]
MAIYQSWTKPFLGLWRIEESETELLAQLASQTDYTSFLERVKGVERRREWLASRCLLKQMLGYEARIAYHPNGAPYLPDEPWQISISHTKGYVAVLLQSKGETGLDVEYRANRVLRIRSRFMSPEEEAGVDPVHEVDYLLVHWCAKETMFKMLGQEDVDFVKHLHVNPFLLKEQGELEVRETRTERQATFRLFYRLFPDFVLVHS